MIEEIKKMFKDCRIIETHISWVVLTGEFAYKVCKPVNFGFLDFSTLEKRKEQCEKEMKVNSLMSPDLYLGVVPLGESGEYAIKMKQMDNDRIMTKLITSGEVGEKEVKEIAVMTAGFHGRTETVADNYTNVAFNWQENFEQTEDFKEQVEDFDLIKGYVFDFLKEKKELMKKRAEEGKIKVCHGDLHSGNIFITDKIYIFDAITFNKRFVETDVAEDIAFMAMDLEFLGRNDLSEVFVSEYINLTGDKELMFLIDFYKCYRAYVRGKVMCFQKNFDEAKKYFKLALEYAHSLG
ncbi:hypothetical protein ACFLZB_03325 [Nanoarchaeota archaeon]